MAADSSRIFIKGLPPSSTDADLRKHFASKGHITDVKCIPNRRIGYVGFKSPQEAATAVKYFNRSFMRMSKISVELAKPVADPSLAKSKVQRKGHGTAIAPDAPSKQPEPSTTDVKKDNAKKRKREDVDESDPKLREYLDVMQPAKKSANTIHEFGGANVEDESAQAAVAVGESESDEEYEAIPARTSVKAFQKNPRPTSPIPDKPPAPPPVERGAVPEVPIPNLTQPSDQPAGPVAGTDDDWLRQKTSRLLDLVDEDDVIPAAAPSPPPHPSASNPEKADGNVSDEDMPDAAAEDQDNNQDVPSAATGDNTAEAGDGALESIRKTSRLFIRNLPYTATEDEIRSYFEQYGSVEEVHVPSDASKNNRGMGFILFSNPEDAVSAFQSDRSSFQGRILHVLPASAKRDHELDEFALSKLPLKQQNLIKKRQKAASSRFNWNSLFMSQDAVNSSIADRLGVSKSELLDPTSADAGVKQAIAETSAIQDTKAYFAAHGVNLEAFKSAPRGDTAILVKNFPYGTTIEEIRGLFEEHGQVLKVLMPPTGTIAIVQFAQASHAKRAFSKLAYRRLKESILFLEKAPKDLFVGPEQQHDVVKPDEKPIGAQKLSVSELLAKESNDEPVETSSLFVKNLHFDTNTAELAAAFHHLEGFRSATVKMKKDPSKPGQMLSMGFGFVSFANKESAEAALKVMNGHVLRGHELQVRASHRGHDAAEERKRQDEASKATGARLIIKNLPFQATKRDIRTLLGSYGQLRSVRIPKKFNATSKGFAFADFVSARDAQSAMQALQDTHLLGRRLILQYAEAEAVDPEEEIAKMQKKVGGQAHKVALQKLTGGGRKRVTLGAEEEEGEQ
ncbi:RNA-binding domain-containing protein [Xylariomycetidae sp. FL0641]|nr:RNA-binding domain-containing protein [Xylariomycetidae sp. FL0641]